MPNPLATKDRAALTLARQAISACQGHLWVALFISLLINVLMLVPPLYMLQIYDRVLPSQNIETLLMLSLICIGLLAALGVFEWLRSKILSRAALRFDQTLSRPVVNAAFSSRLARRDELHGTAVQDLDTVRQFIQGRGIITLFDAPWIPIFLFTVFLIDPWLGWVATGGTLALLALAALTQVISRGPLQRSQTANVKARRLLDGQLAQAEVIQAMGMKAKVAAIWGRIHSRGLTEAEEALERISGVNACSRSLRIILQSGVLGVGAYAAIEGRITPGMMIAASILVGRAMAPMELLIGHWRGLRQTQSAWRRVDHLLRLHPQPTFSTRLPRPEGDLRIEQLAVSPPGSQKIVLQNVNLTVPKGAIVAITGSSGSGKSTLLRAIAGVWPLRAGKIRVDGNEISHFDPSDRGSWIGYLPQDIELIEGTVADNISRFTESTSERVLQAARDAGAHQMIQNLPRGYDTEVGPNGEDLSGGQRQLIGLARALFGHPSLVILDEPDSNLDESGDKALVSALSGCRQRKTTVLIVSHRPRILDQVDHVIRIDNLDGRRSVADQPEAKQGSPVLPERVAASPIVAPSTPNGLGTAGLLKPYSATGPEA